MKIVLAGDSWGIGVFQGHGDNYGPTGEGIQTIFEAKHSHHQIINVSKAGASNKEIYERIKRAPLFASVDTVIFIQTDAFREHSHYENNYKILHKDFIDQIVDNFNTLEDFFEHYYNSLYKKLSTVNRPVLCIGGWSQLHPCIENYANLIPLVPSATMAILPELKKDVYLSDFEWFPQLDAHKKFYSKFKDELKQIAVDSAAKFDMLCKHCGDCHPNLNGYKILVEKIEKYLLQDK